MSAWTATPIQSSSFPRIATGHRSRPLSTVVVVSTVRSSSNGEAKVVGGLGRAVLTAFTAQIPATNSKPPSTTSSSVPRKTQIRHLREGADNDDSDDDDEDDDLQLSGSDVLQALQQAASRKIKNKSGSSGGGVKKKSTISGKKEEDQEDYSQVKPLMIRSDWGKRIQDLEGRLQQLSEF